MDDTYDWDEIEPHIVRHASGCRTWDGSPAEGVFRLVSEALGIPLPSRNGKCYRMPDCTMGKECVNPNHVGSLENYYRTLEGQRRDTPEPSEMCSGMKLTARDKRFLKSLNITCE
jgi:hypothetical protein